MEKCGYQKFTVTFFFKFFWQVSDRFLNFGFWLVFLKKKKKKTVMEFQFLRVSSIHFGLRGRAGIFGEFLLSEQLLRHVKSLTISWSYMQNKQLLGCTFFFWNRTICRQSQQVFLQDYRATERIQVVSNFYRDYSKSNAFYLFLLKLQWIQRAE